MTVHPIPRRASTPPPPAGDDRIGPEPVVDELSMKRPATGELGADERGAGERGTGGATPGAAMPGRRFLDESAQIRFTPDGVPLVLRWHGGLWQIVGNSVSWVNAKSWWEPGPTALGGQGVLLRIRHWRFHAQTGPASPILRFHMSTDSSTSSSTEHTGHTGHTEYPGPHPTPAGAMALADPAGPTGRPAVDGEGDERWRLRQVDVLDTARDALGL